MSDGSAGDHGEGQSVGERLAEARAARGLTLAEVAEATRIPIRHLQKIESGDHKGLPAPTYSAGFVKSYARFVGLDGQALSDEFRGESGPATALSRSESAPYEPADPARTPPRALAVLALLAAVVIGLGYLYWRGTTEQPAEIAAEGVAPVSPVPPPPGGVPVATPPPVGAPQPAIAPGRTVAIAADKDVWIKVYEEGGATLFMGVLKGGDRYELPAGTVDPKLTTGRPGSTFVTVGTQAIPTLGDPDRLAKNISLKPAALLARLAAAPAATPAAGVPATNPGPV